MILIVFKYILIFFGACIGQIALMRLMDDKTFKRFYTQVIFYLMQLPLIFAIQGECFTLTLFYIIVHLCGMAFGHNCYENIEV